MATPSHRAVRVHRTAQMVGYTLLGAHLLNLASSACALFSAEVWIPNNYFSFGSDSRVGSEQPKFQSLFSSRSVHISLILNCLLLSLLQCVMILITQVYSIFFNLVHKFSWVYICISFSGANKSFLMRTNSYIAKMHGVSTWSVGRGVEGNEGRRKRRRMSPLMEGL